MPMAQPRIETRTNRAVTVPSRVGARELEASFAAWPRGRAMTDRAGSSGAAIMPVKNIAQTGSGTRSKDDRPGGRIREPATVSDSLTRRSRDVIDL
jgi:hypothetical protein